MISAFNAKVTPVQLTRTLESQDCREDWPKVTDEEIRAQHQPVVDYAAHEQRLGELMNGPMMKALGQFADRHTNAYLTSLVEDVFQWLKVTRQVIRPCEGLQIVGAVADTATYDQNLVLLRLRTDFFPPLGPRMRVPRLHGMMTLGTYRDGDTDYDLYVAEQGNLPPTLIARYGDGPSDYISCNPAMLGPERVRDSGPAIAEAFGRALGLHYDLKLDPHLLYRIYQEMG